MVQEIGMVAEWTLSGKEAVLRTKVAVEQNREFVSNAKSRRWGRK